MSGGFLKMIQSLKLTASLPLKIDGWKMRFPFGALIFRGLFGMAMENPPFWEKSQGVSIQLTGG